MIVRIGPAAERGEFLRGAGQRQQCQQQGERSPPAGGECGDAGGKAGTATQRRASVDAEARTATTRTNPPRMVGAQYRCSRLPPGLRAREEL